MKDPTDTIDKDGNSINLFTDAFMGSPFGSANEPWLSAGFYNPYPEGENYRVEDNFEYKHINPADSPMRIDSSQTRWNSKKIHGKQ